MKAIKIKGIAIEEIVFLQDIIAAYIQILNSKCSIYTNKLGYTVIALDLCSTIYYKCRSKIESTKNVVSFSLRPSEAVVLFEMTLDKNFSTSLSDYQKFLLEKYKNILAAELTNI